jgi:hypothetical protein
MNSVPSRDLSRLGRVRSVAVGLFVAGLVAACSVAELPSSSAGPTTSPGPSATASPASSPSASAATASATASASIGPVPSGAWTGITWIDEQAAFPQTPVPATTDGTAGVGVFGWSGGYVGFRTASDITIDTTSGKMNVAVAMVSTSSPDGAHWTSGQAMDIKGLTDAVYVDKVIEGPSGLLAVGRYGRAACGGPSTVNALWTSTDGQTWTRATPSSDFATARVYTIDGDSDGFVATGALKDGATQAIWLSTDGVSWRRVAVPTVTTGTFVLDGATAFASGYVVAGAVLGDEGCGGPSQLTPSLWWSATGTGWSRVKLPGATPANDAAMAVTRVSDHALMAIATVWDSGATASPESRRPGGLRSGISGEWQEIAHPTQTVWVSSNGQDWKLVQSPSSMLNDGVMTDGRRGLVAETPDGGVGGKIATVGDDLGVTVLTESGAVPDALSGYWTYGLGPNGVVCVLSDGTDLRVGRPAVS